MPRHYSTRTVAHCQVKPPTSRLAVAEHSPGSSPVPGNYPGKDCSDKKTFRYWYRYTVPHGSFRLRSYDGQTWRDARNSVAWSLAWKLSHILMFTIHNSHAPALFKSPALLETMRLVAASATKMPSRSVEHCPVLPVWQYTARDGGAKQWPIRFSTAAAVSAFPGPGGC